MTYYYLHSPLEPAKDSSFQSRQETEKPENVYEPPAGAVSWCSVGAEGHIPGKTNLRANTRLSPPGKLRFSCSPLASLNHGQSPERPTAPSD